MTQTPVPQRTRFYKNHHLDSTRWDSYKPRPGDVIISTSIKAGTTWMQRILSLLIFGTGDLPMGLWQLSPWVDSRIALPKEMMIQLIEAQDHQRFLKSHLPADALPYYEDVKYIFVGRDTRDVFMSLWNHYGSYTDLTYNMLAFGDPEGGPCPRCPDDIREFWHNWITRAWFDWEPDGWPLWSHHYHASSFWKHRRVPNILFVHYNDLLADLESGMRRVAEFTSIEVAEKDWPALVDAARFDSMKADAEKLLPETGMVFKGGPRGFVYKGSNSRWREVLTPEDLELYEDAASRAMEPSLRGWLENGSLVAGEPASL